MCCTVGSQQYLSHILAVTVPACSQGRDVVDMNSGHMRTTALFCHSELFTG
jgi:hypothetical protein